MDQQDLFDVARRLGLHDDSPGAVWGAGIGVDQDRPEIREVLDEAGLSRTDDVADSRRVPKARDPDHDVGTTEPGYLILDFGSQRAGRHRWHRTTPGGSGDGSVRRSYRLGIETIDQSSVAASGV